VRIAARPLGVTRVDATHEAVQLQFMKNPPIDGAKVIDFIRKKGAPRASPAREAARRRQAPGLAGARRRGERTSCSSSPHEPRNRNMPCP
jgi:hypothetical protein